MPHAIPVGGGFGELALFYEEPRSATVFAKEPTSTWILDKKTFRGGLARRVEEMCSENAKFLMEVPFFKEFEGFMLETSRGIPAFLKKQAKNSTRLRLRDICGRKKLNFKFCAGTRSFISVT